MVSIFARINIPFCEVNPKLRRPDLRRQQVFVIVAAVGVKIQH